MHFSPSFTQQAELAIHLATMIDDKLNERQFMIEQLCNDYLDDALDEKQMNQLVHGLLIDADLRRETRETLFLHEALKTIDFNE